LWLKDSAKINPGQELTYETTLGVSSTDQTTPTLSHLNDATDVERQSQKSECTLADSQKTTKATPFMLKTILTQAPTPRDSEDPIFSTPETVKAGHPVPKAPVVVFPQRNLLKVPTLATKGTTLEPLTTPKPSEKAIEGAWVATGRLPDIRNLSRDQREDLGRGPKVTISVGGVSTPTIPKKLLVQVSETANDFFTKNPNAKEMPFPRGSMAGGAVCEFAKWINDICTASKEFSVKIRFPNITKDADMQNLAIMNAARVLGMLTYVRHFTRYYCDEIRKLLLPLSTIALIEQYATIGDPVYECLVNNLAHHRSKKTIPDQERFNRFLIAHPRLAADLEKADRKIEAKRGVRTTVLYSRR
jgi:hypothetical protein